MDRVRGPGGREIFVKTGGHCCVRSVRLDGVQKFPSLLVIVNYYI